MLEKVKIGPSLPILFCESSVSAKENQNKNTNINFPNLFVIWGLISLNLPPTESV